MTTQNRAASVRARLLNKAKNDGLDFQLLLTRFALERMLYRLHISGSERLRPKWKISAIPLILLKHFKHKTRA